MKKIGDHMNELGFNENASDETKKAFIKYLMREAQFHDRVTNLNKYKNVSELVKNEMLEDVGEQLLLFDDTGTD